MSIDWMEMGKWISEALIGSVFGLLVYVFKKGWERREENKRGAKMSRKAIRRELSAGKLVPSSSVREAVRLAKESAPYITSGFVVGFAVLFAVRGNPLQPVDTILSQADTWQQAGDYDQAIKLYTRVLKRDTDNISALLGRGDTHQALGEFDSAIEDYSAATSVDPRNAVVFLKRGRAYAESGAYEPAIADYRRVQQFDTELVLRAAQLEAELFSALGDFQQALEGYKKALSAAIEQENEPQIARVLAALGITFYQLEEYENSLIALNEAYVLALQLNDQGLADQVVNFVVSEDTIFVLEDLLRGLNPTETP